MNSNDLLIQKTADFVKQNSINETSGHDWKHAEVVWNNAKEIEKEIPGVNFLVVELAALLHDVDDWKNEDGGLNKTEKWLTSLDLEPKMVSEILDIIEKVSFFGQNSPDKETSIEGQIVRDADRLEAVGAVAWDRVKLFCRAKGIPNINEYLPNPDLTEEEYRNFRRKENSGINHVFEKLLFVKNRLMTKKGQEMGLARHEELKNVVREYLESIKSKELVPDSRIEEYIKMLDETRFN